MKENKILQPTEEARKLIADASVDFLRSRLELSQELVSDRKERTITLQDYIREVEDNRDDREMLAYLKNKYSHNIVLNSSEIDSLASLVRESLTKYSIGDVAYLTSFSHLVSDAVRNYVNNLPTDRPLTEEEIMYKATASKFNYLKFGDDYDYHFGIDTRVDGRVSWRYSDEFYIRDSQDNLVAKIGLYGTDKMVSENIEKQEEDIFFAKDLFLGYLYKSDDNERYPTLFLRKKVDGKEYMKAFMIDDKLYSITSKLHPTQEDSDCAVVLSNMNNVLWWYDCSYLMEDIYNEYDLSSILNVWIDSGELTEEDKQKMDSVIEVATNWWADAIKLPTFDNGDAVANKLATNLNADMKQPEDDKIEKFKKYLGNEIRKGITVNFNRGFTLYVDYAPDPDSCLSVAANKAHLDAGVARFPWYTTMFITRDKVSVSKGYCAPEEVLYDANQSSMMDDNGTSAKKYERKKD